MSTNCKSGAVLFAKNTERVARFYAALADMKVTYSGKELIVLDAPDHQLILHPLPPSIARAIVITEPPKRRTGTAVKLVFAVKSIADARARAPALGGALHPPEGMFEARGFRACDGHDPEGNVIQFREIADAPAKAAAQKRSRKGSVDYEAVHDVAMALPDVAASATLRGTTFKARGKLLACKATHRSAEPQSLVVRVAPEDRDRLIVAEPQSYYVTPHYLSSSVVLARLQVINRKALESLLELAWRFVTSHPSAGGRKGAKRKKAASVFRYLKA
jgi:hypothetical protein